MNATMDIQSRLWGVWEARFYGSGTTIVGLKVHQHKPNLYIYADANPDDSKYQGDRYEMCKQLAAFMNGGPRPSWLDDFDRQSEGYAESLAGANITATGPSVDIDPPNMNWRQDDSEDAKSDRAKLLDVLFIGEVLQ